MIDAGKSTEGADKYFHCKINCETSMNGPVGDDLACYVSTRKEWDDLYNDGDPLEWSFDDFKANSFGRSQGTLNPGASCRDLCASYRPPGMPAGY